MPFAIIVVILGAAAGLCLLTLAAFRVWKRDDSALHGPVSAALEVVGGPLAGQCFPLSTTGEVITVGSLEGNNTIVLPDPEVSRKHLGIRLRPGQRSGAVQFELADLGSIHGVEVNGQRMAKRVLASGDIIRLGASEMVFRIEKVG